MTTGNGVDVWSMWMVFVYIFSFVCLSTYSLPINHKTNRPPLNETNLEEGVINKLETAKPLHKRQKLTLIGYASDDGPARHLVAFSKRYNLDLHLIGVGKPWGGFNDKINGFYKFIESIDNTHNESIILILDAYDTVPICHKDQLLKKFNSFNADIVISTGKDCWPDPNVENFLNDRLSEEEKEKYGKFFPWFLCPNSGAIMGKHDAMLSMLRRVAKLVHLGNGSCADFEGNKFTKNTQSDQRCYTTYYVELTKYHDYQKMIKNLTINDIKNGAYNPQTKELDISKLSNMNGDHKKNKKASIDGTVSKSYFLKHDKEVEQYYAGITMKLDYANDLFLSMGGMMFMDIEINIKNKSYVSMRSKVTNGTSCVVHGNGPGVILFRSFIKQIKYDGDLDVPDLVLRVGVDFFHWILWWIMMPMERLSHWLSVTFGFDFGFHSTTFRPEVIWRFHVFTFVGVIIIVFIPLYYWYKYRFKPYIKVRKHYVKKNKNDKIKKEKKKMIHIKNMKKNKKYNYNKYKNKNKKQFKDVLNIGLTHLEIMVPSMDSNIFTMKPKTQKKN